MPDHQLHGHRRRIQSHHLHTLPPQPDIPLPLPRGGPISCQSPGMEHCSDDCTVIREKRVLSDLLAQVASLARFQQFDGGWDWCGLVSRWILCRTLSKPQSLSNEALHNVGLGCDTRKACLRPHLLVPQPKLPPPKLDKCSIYAAKFMKVYHSCVSELLALLQTMSSSRKVLPHSNRGMYQHSYHGTELPTTPVIMLQQHPPLDVRWMFTFSQTWDPSYRHDWNVCWGRSKALHCGPLS